MVYTLTPMMVTRSARRMSFASLVAACCAAFGIALAPVLTAAEVERTGGPFVPTPQTVVDAMLDLAKVTKDDFVIDLGSGDGRIVLTAAQRYSARGVGVDIDPELVEKSNAEAMKRGMSERIKFMQKDVLQADVADATVLTLYLLPGMMKSLQAKLVRELRPGTRIVSHDFAFGDWKADRELSVDVPEKFGQTGQWKSTLYYWVVPAQVAGAWQVNVDGLRPELLLSLEQRYQDLQGTVTTGDRRRPIANARVAADRIAFTLELADGAYEFKGVIAENTIEGEALHAGRTSTWRAVRAASPGG
jgi:precorrin-6B methylase 2